MAERRILVPLVEVRVLVPELYCPVGLAVRTPASHAGNRGSIPLGSAIQFSALESPTLNSPSYYLAPAELAVFVPTKYRSAHTQHAKASPMQHKTVSPVAKPPVAS